MLPMTRDGFTYRLATNADGPQIVRLIDSVYREHGDSVALEQADADLLDIQRHYLDRGGVFSVLASASGQVVASHALLPLDARVGTLRRLYLIPELRGSEWGNILMNWALAQATLLGLDRLELWSDVRFTRAHRFFERFGFRHDGRIRAMADGNMPYREKYFAVALHQAIPAPPFLPLGKH